MNERDPNCAVHGETGSIAAIGLCSCARHNLQRDLGRVRTLARNARALQGTLTDAAAVKRAMDMAAVLSHGSGDTFVRLIANVIVDLNQTPPEAGIPKLRDAIAVSRPPNQHSVWFQNSGFCRQLRDDPNSDAGNLPHHMLFYFVLTYFWNRMAKIVDLSGIVAGGVLLHELDTWRRGPNPEGPGDIRSGMLGTMLGQQLARRRKNFVTFADTFASHAIAPNCGHADCKSAGERL